jgi:hypothetical protein
MNNIFWEDNATTDGSEIHIDINCNLLLYYNDINTSLVTGTWTGEGNIDVDPDFQEGDSMCHLNGGSPCQNTGIESIEIENLIYVCPDHDYEGDPRPDPFGGPDIGADEHFYVGEEDLQVTGCRLQVYPNPISGAVCLRYQIKDKRYLISDLYSISGQKIRQFLNEELISGIHEIEVDMHDLPAGVYFCTLKTEEGIETVKVVKY